MEKQYTVITGPKDTEIFIPSAAGFYLKHSKMPVQGGMAGVSVAPESFIKAAQETNADAILMSSLYGMAELDLQGFKNKCKEAGLEDVLLYIGGNLSIGRHDFKDDEVKFKKLGSIESTRRTSTWPRLSTTCAMT